MRSPYIKETAADELLTPGQLAREWKVSPRTVARYIADGKLPATKLPSGRVRIRRGDADGAVTRLNNRASA